VELSLYLKKPIKAELEKRFEGLIIGGNSQDLVNMPIKAELEKRFEGLIIGGNSQDLVNISFSIDIRIFAIISGIC